MAVRLPPSGGDDRYLPLAEINITPMVDVMLVLLVIFMVAAPLLTVGVPINLPKTSAAQVTVPQEPIVVSMNQSGDTLPVGRGHERLKAHSADDLFESSIVAAWRDKECAYRDLG